MPTNTNPIETKKIMALSSSVNIIVPTSWDGLTDEQLAEVCAWSASTLYNIEEVKSLFLLRFCITPAQREGLTAADLLPAIEALDWLDHPPTTPIRIELLHGRQAVDASLHGVSFENYLIAENCFQGWVATQSAAPLQDLASVLYPSEEAMPALSEGECYGLAIWWTGLKSLFSLHFSDLLRPAAPSEDEGEADMAEAMNAQIRALTGGDITKEQLVLSADCWRALTELNAKAREARELNEKLKK